MMNCTNHYSSHLSMSLARAFIMDMILFSQGNKSYGQFTASDEGDSFDQSKFDANWPQMQRWFEAGVNGGIPFLS